MINSDKSVNWGPYLKPNLFGKETLCFCRKYLLEIINKVCSSCVKIDSLKGQGSLSIGEDGILSVIVGKVNTV